MNAIVAKACATLESARYYLEYLNPEEYQRALPHFSGGSIGKHTRHFIEGFQCLLEQFPAGAEVNYDIRRRNMEIEASPAYAIRCIEAITGRLPHIKVDRDLWLNSDFGVSVRMRSSFEREIYHNIDHTVHHLAIIRIGLMAVAPAIYLPEHFGVAASTMRHRAAQTMAEN